jgi:mannose-6-phosphate isomerase-like protein (cupin superfamily)
MPVPGQELTDPATDARLRFLSTSASTGGSCVRMELTVEAGWSAGPLHVHPRQTERLRVTAGRFHGQVGRKGMELLPGDEIEVPPATSHTIELIDRCGSVEVEFTPALRTDELFETMFSARFPRRPPEFVPSAARAWVESRGFAAEIRYLWPRRLALAGAGSVLVLCLVRAVSARISFR